MKKVITIAAICIAVAVIIAGIYVAFSRSWGKSVQEVHKELPVQLRACEYSFVRHFSVLLLMYSLSRNALGEEYVGKAMAIALLNALSTPCLVAPYGVPQSKAEVRGIILVRSLNISNDKLSLGEMVSTPFNMTMYEENGKLVVYMGSRRASSSTIVEFYEPPLVSKEISNMSVSVPYSGGQVSRISEYSYSRDEIIKEYCAALYLPAAPKTKQCLVLNENGVLLVNESRTMGSRELYQAIKKIGSSVIVKAVNATAFEMIINYNVSLKGLDLRLYADETISYLDLGGAILMTKCFAKRIKLYLAIGSSKYDYSAGNELLMLAKVSKAG